MGKLIPLTLIFLLASCTHKAIHRNDLSTATRNKSNGDIVWNQKTYQSIRWKSSNNINKMFTDDPETQEVLREAQMLHRVSYGFLWGGFAASVLYGINSIANDNYNETTYLSIFFGAGAIPALSFLYMRNYHIDQAIEKYNKKKGYVFSPAVFEIDKKKRVGMNFVMGF